ncbi:DUF4142 domain-containing protein [Spirilliplanes yamanashiensis]|uniref:DUF4142 domain-containing protein n=1 Tax=Spirilliplanes yamanashiensis TaxID=42233 RepID=A0A8J3Y8G0_9ACTN|nr:DUF4142 domain-containing protein [Spirilliplanes yamanashiensis]MDP9815667.1 putative membrane protein [Spirilliplanes yamanashiensis]GIJ03921.1 hypothetical protein Sya03_32730 [Spirilliplanes yamanashiensis]
MSLRRLAVTLGVIVLFLAPGAAAAAASAQDVSYLQAAHQANLSAMALGEIAGQRGESEQVRRLGARLVADHARLDDDLLAAAGDLGVSLPELATEPQRDLAERYHSASDEEFDALFVSTQLEAHAAAQRLTRDQLAGGEDERAVQAARRAATTLAGHHDLIAAAARDLGVPSRIGTGTGGQAAAGTGAATALIVAGALLVAVAALLLLRRRTPAHTPSHAAGSRPPRQRHWADRVRPGRHGAASSS